MLILNRRHLKSQRFTHSDHASTNTEAASDTPLSSSTHTLSPEKRTAETEHEHNHLSDNQMTVAQLKHIYQTKEILLSKIGHELLTPLNGIMGSLELALSSEEPLQHNNMINTALQSASKLNRLIRDIIDLSQLTQGELQLQKQPFQFKDSLSQLFNSAAEEARTKGLSWHQQINIDSSLSLNGDMARIIQILRNLIDNAIKFTPSGSVSITINSSIKSDRLFLFEATIEDTGIGIHQDEQQEIYNSFYQIEAFCKRRYQGSGVGLSLAYLLAKKMGGSIHLHSVPDCGSRFHIEIPLPLSTPLSRSIVDAVPVQGRNITPFPQLKNTKPQPDSPDSKEAHNNTVQPESPSSKTDPAAIQLDGHILIVEDNDVNQMILKKLLAKLGLSSEIAGNGAIALEKLKVGSFDVILMDCQMPVMDGPTATREIRAWTNEKSNIPIIAVTANITEKDRDLCLEVGMNDYITKPIHPNKLYPTLSKWLNYAKTQTDTNQHTGH